MVSPRSDWSRAAGLDGTRRSGSNRRRVSDVEPAAERMEYEGGDGGDGIGRVGANCWHRGGGTKWETLRLQ